MAHLESLIAEFLNWQGYVVKQNVMVGKRRQGGWTMELDVVAYQPSTKDLVHYEPSLDAHSWSTRESRFTKKFAAGRKYIFTEVFPWLSPKQPLRQLAILISHPRGRDSLCGAEVQSVDELLAEIRDRVKACGIAGKSAIPESYPMLRTLQLSHCGYYRVVTTAA